MRAGFIYILALFALTLAYVIWHLWLIVPGAWPVKAAVVAAYILWMALAFSPFFLRGHLPGQAVSVLYGVGLPWLVAHVYLALAFILADTAVLCKILPKAYISSSCAGSLAIFGVVALTMVAGGLHYRHKFREEISLQTEKPLPRPLTVVAASDLHLGYSIGRDELAGWIDRFIAESPDLVLLCGDVIDIQLKPVLEGGYAEEFRRLKCPVVVVPGNHEYIAGIRDVHQFFDEAGITLLRDSVAHFDGLDIIGRDDRSNPGREALSELADSLGGFTILLDHQPFNLEEAEQAGIDFQFSGHTHRGQFWPLSIVTDIMYEKSWGHHRRGATRYYVSSGLGIWGPKVRIGSRSEYVVLHIGN